MEEIINDITEIITEREQESCVSKLTECAISISKVAFMALRGELRDRALDIAKAIADYEDALNKCT